jgi:hypothetical protein
MRPTFEAEITPDMSPREVVELGKLAEQAGFDRLGISCVALWPVPINCKRWWLPRPIESTSAAW